MIDLKKVKQEKGELINERLEQFKKVKNDNDIFKELCFCLLTANFNAERAIKIQQEINDGFLTMTKEELAIKLKELGYRYPNTRAGYISEAQIKKDEILNAFKTLKEYELREWLADNVKGLGMKESSHLLRNTGYTNSAIIDFHIIDLMEREELITRPKNLNKKNYLLIEDKLKNLNNNLAELDLMLWYLETGKILK
ncbi:MAG TPA: N-glycosylase/DNA lyase [Candidatus Nanoarchaeia archaeon]|nr:N-glycosylase/DNA lyase [Candidatus Nanoarchaeia archaeon]